MPRPLAMTARRPDRTNPARNSTQSRWAGRPGWPLSVVAAWALLSACATQPPDASAGEVTQAPAGQEAPASQEEASQAEASQAEATAPSSPGDEPSLIEEPSPAEEPGAETPPNPLESFGGEILGAPGEQWQVDEAGRRFFLIEIERKPYYKVLANGFVMLPPGAAYELAEEREETLVVRVLDPQQLEATKKERPRAQPGRGEMVADLAALEVPTVDRITLENAGVLGRRGQWRQGFELADMNGDGHLDLVHGPPRKSRGVPRIFLGDGDGGWRNWPELRFESDPLDYGDVAVADYDGDGELDMALAIHLRGLVVLRGDGEGTFTQWGEGLPYWYPGSGRSLQPYSSRTVEAVDWNRDGRPDLLTLGEGPRLVRDQGAEAPGVSHGERGAILFLNGGDGTWTRYDQKTPERQLFGDGLAVGDFDGDGRSDFAIASNVSGATKIIKMGTEDGGWEDVALPGIVRPGSYGSVHAADLDGDGRDELLLGFAAAGPEESWWTGIDLVELEDGEWLRAPLVAVPENRGAVTALATGDLDGDGLIDLVGLTGAGDRWILLGTGPKSFVREASEELAPKEVECQGYDVAVAPVGAGGAPVLIMGFAGEPGSETIFGNVERRCPSEGSLETWSVAERRE